MKTKNIIRSLEDLSLVSQRTSKSMKRITTFAQLPAASQTLLTQSFVHGNIGALFKSDPRTAPAWAAFAESWCDLLQDNYMEDGGAYRLRRYSEFHRVQKTRTLSVLPHKSYRQSKEDNYLNGEIDRLYSPIGQTLQTCVTLKQPGDFIFLNDKLTKHSVQPVSRIDPAKEGSRDALIAMFIQQHPSRQ